MTPAAHPLENRRFMYLSYVDDSGSTGSNLDDKDTPFQVIGGPIIDEQVYGSMETVLAGCIEELIPQDQWEDFEFKACDLFHANKPFEALGKEKCRGVLTSALEWIQKFNIPVLYGAIDKPKLRSKLFRTAKPVDMAFQLYLQALDEWFEVIFELTKHEFKDPSYK
jgi:hypothetical protein